MNYVTETELTKYFSHNLKQLRNRRTPPVTQQQLASRLHVDRGLIAKYESGLLLPSICLTINLARYFNTTVESLFAEAAGLQRKEQKFEDITPHNQKTYSGRKIQDN